MIIPGTVRTSLPQPPATPGVVPIRAIATPPAIPSTAITRITHCRTEAGSLAGFGGTTGTAAAAPGG